MRQDAAGHEDNAQYQPEKGGAQPMPGASIPEVEKRKDQQDQTRQYINRVEAE